jgi:hypothetical protein
VLAVVVIPGSESLLRPIVRKVFDIKHKRYVTPQDIDLSDKLDCIVQSESPHSWGINPFNYL